MVRRLLLLFAVAVTTSTPVGWAQNNAPANTTVATVGGAGANAWAGNIRASDEGLVALVTEGIKRSATLRTLTERLTKSDVIVYVRPDMATRSNTQGRLAFVSAAGGFRYLKIYVPFSQSREQQIATLGHELQHAVAIAEAPAVVDSDSLRREFERIGNVNQSAGAGGALSFDSPAAVEIRRRILREVAGEKGS
jgi:hypothetical protein